MTQRRFVLIAWLSCSGLGLGCSSSPTGAHASDGAVASGSTADASPSTRDAAQVMHADAALDAAHGVQVSGDAGANTTADAALDAGSGLPGWKLVWNDEFEGATGTSPDATHWGFETGGTGWGNNELEFYTARPENASLDGQGNLVITARKEAYMGRDYTSARMTTQGKLEHGYGRYEARMRVPQGQGVWPAFWMLGMDIGSAGWPTCGEIDIMENIGKEPSTVHGTLHGPGYSGDNGIAKAFDLPGGAKFADGFHVFALEWEAAAVRWYVDGALYETRTPSDLPAGKTWVYDHPFFLILNLAVGGPWPGNPDGSSVFPQTLTVDYVRVYEPN